MLSGGFRRITHDTCVAENALLRVKRVLRELLSYVLPGSACTMAGGTLCLGDLTVVRRAPQ